MEMAYRYTNNNQEDIGKIFGVDYSTVSQNRKRLKLKLEKDLRLRKAFNKIGERLDKMSERNRLSENAKTKKTGINVKGVMTR